MTVKPWLTLSFTHSLRLPLSSPRTKTNTREYTILDEIHNMHEWSSIAPKHVCGWLAAGTSQRFEGLEVNKLEASAVAALTYSAHDAATWFGPAINFDDPSTYRLQDVEMCLFLSKFILPVKIVFSRMRTKIICKAIYTESDCRWSCVTVSFQPQCWGRSLVWLHQELKPWFSASAEKSSN